VQFGAPTPDCVVALNNHLRRDTPDAARRIGLRGKEGRHSRLPNTPDAARLIRMLAEGALARDPRMKATGGLSCETRKVPQGSPPKIPDISAILAVLQLCHEKSQMS